MSDEALAADEYLLGLFEMANSIGNRLGEGESHPVVSFAWKLAAISRSDDTAAQALYELDAATQVPDDMVDNMLTVHRVSGFLLAHGLDVTLY
jgi:hypothetical protein